MLDFMVVSTRSTKRGTIEIYPKFLIKKSTDLMIRGGDFYAIWIEERGLWSTDEQDALQLIDRELDRYAEENRQRFNSDIKVLHMWDAESGMIDSWHKYCQKQLRDSFHTLDDKLIFSNTETTKKDYASKRLNYPLEEGDLTAYEKLISTLYSPEERMKIEWAIGSIVCGESQKLQKFLVLYGAAGTGKSTILNIIANILIQGKTVQVVSNNNSATENVFEKLSSSKYNLGFIVATLGKSDNKTNFISNQKTNYPDFTSWKSDDIQDDFMQQVQEKSKKLKTVFDKQERLAQLNQELNRLKIERKYFNEYLNETNVTVDYTKYKRSMKSNKWMKLWQECQSISEVKKDINFFLKLKFFFKYGLYNFSIYSLEISQIITTFQAFYYETRENEILKELDDITAYLNNTSNHLLDNLTNDSMKFLKNYLANKYEKNTYRQLFTSEDFLKNPYDILNEYPVILSTTFSSRDSLNDNVVYDYVIMDESSQVDIATGALAMSCAKNMVIVGDTNQLPNVVDKHTEIRADVIFNQYNLSKGYRFTNSFLQSVLEVMPNVTQTMLREHYRCHPKIIEFCNQKFYRGNLIIMTEDHGEKDVLKVIKTVKGNHSRNHFSQRQIDIIKNEIIPNDITNKKETGIISPYNNQVQSLKEQIDGIEQATVHKFQGKEKDTIIISTVEDEITDFVDDPYLLNVAVSRAKKKLILVVTGNEQNKERNIMDLIDYIQYNNFEVVESNVYSIFDYLYKQYTKERKLFLNKNNRKLEYDSENLMYTLLEEILKNDDYKMLDFVCHFPVNMLIKNPYLLNDDECLYAMNPATHVDFLVYNRISKRAILAIEVDGYAFHQKETTQAKRDLLKNHIFELYYIPLLRFSTTGSGEREKIINMLNKILNIGDLK